MTDQHLDSQSAAMDWSYAQGRPLVSGVLRSQPEDFCVEEILGFEPSGNGEHVFLWIEKRCLTTFAVRDAIARLAGVRAMDVGFAGLKDKRAVTSQWFSVYLPSAEDIDWPRLQQLAAEGRGPRGAESALLVKKVTRHNKKLRRGVHSGNRFRIVVSSFSGDSDSLQDRIDLLASQGVPNYFGEQRFGRQGANLIKLAAAFDSDDRRQWRLKSRSRDQRSMLLSAARAFLFNQLLSMRVTEGSWNSYVEGDTLMLRGSRSQFSIDIDDSPEGQAERKDVAQRLVSGDLSITGLLWGDGAVANTLERKIETQHANWVQALSLNRLQAARRSLRVLPEQIEWGCDGEKLQIEFFLPTGSYATMVLRELIEYNTVS